MQIVNVGGVNYDFLLEEGKKISKSELSNKAVTNIIECSLEAEKSVNKKLSMSFDILTYKVNIKNICNHKINNLFFKDNLPKETIYFNSSLRINGVKSCKDPYSGFFLENLMPGKAFTICFKVLILPGFYNTSIKNKAFFIYDYIYDISLPPKRITIWTNETEVYIENKIFKQFIIENTINLKRCQQEVQFIKSYHVSAAIKDVKVTYEWDKLCTILILGKMLYCINYISYENKNVNIRKVYGFSSLFHAPSSIKYLKNKSFNITIEKNSILLIKKRSIFISSSVLLKDFNNIT